MAISDNTVAIIGTGNIGSRLAANFAAGDLDFLLASRDADAARKIAADLDGHAEAAVNPGHIPPTDFGHAGQLITRALAAARTALAAPAAGLSSVSCGWSSAESAR